MAVKEQRSITPAEWEVMRVVWANGPSTSKEIRGILNEEMGWKSATTKTLIGRLKDKKILLAEKAGRHYVYSANVSEEDSFVKELQEVFSSVCHRKAGDYLNAFVKNLDLSKSDIHQLMETLEEKLLVASESLPCQCLPGQCKCKDCC